MLINDLIHIGRERDGIGAKETEDGKVHSWAFALTQHPQIKKRPERERKTRLERHLECLPSCSNQLGMG